MFSNANPLHYYVFRVPRKVDRWRYVWSIFESRLGRPHYVWDEYLYSVGLREKVEVRVTVSVTVCVIVLCGMMMMKGREKVKPGACS